MLLSSLHLHLQHSPDPVRDLLPRSDPLASFSHPSLPSSTARPSDVSRPGLDPKKRSSPKMTTEPAAAGAPSAGGTEAAPKQYFTGIVKQVKEA